MVQNLSLGLPYSTSITELVAIASLSTASQEVLQPENPLNRWAIERIMKVEAGGDVDGDGASSS